MSVNYFEILGVAPDASPADLKRAFRALSRKYHPDRNQDDPEAEEKFKKVKRAYEVLSDPKQRRRHQGDHQPEQTIVEFFRKSSGAHRVDQVLRPQGGGASVVGGHLVQIIEVHQKVLENGGYAAVVIQCPKTGDPMEMCLKILAGRRFARLPKLGESGKNGGEDGDLILHLIAKQEP
jgi:curved DNA-binding protein CbpA